MQNFYRYRWIIISIFAVVIIFSAIAMPQVGVNYDIMSYLPQNSPSTIALNKMQENFSAAGGEETRIMLEVSSIPQAVEYKEQIRRVNNVTEVRWLDDVADIYQPESFINQSVLDTWYKDGFALYRVTFEPDLNNEELLSAVDEIYAHIGSHAAVSGGEAGNAVQKRESGGMATQMMVILLPVVLIIMIFSTRSWVEPLLFLAVIGISILINMGTNIFLGEISFVSQMTTAALQLAVSMDYSIFLIHTFTHHRDSGKEPMDAMKAAMKQAYPSIIASALTTLCGFLALTLMRFGIGADLGIVLAKGAAISLLTVIFLLPVVTMLIYKPLEKFTHRPFIPKFDSFSRVVLKIGVPLIIILAILVVPSFLAQSNNKFVYMSSESGGSSNAIAEHFSTTEQMFLLVPEGDIMTERDMAKELQGLSHITNITSYVTTVGIEIPFESLPKDTQDMLSGGGYSRIILTVDVAQGDDAGYTLVETVRQTAEGYYGNSYYLSGGLVSLYDMRGTVTADNTLTTIVSIIAISLIVLITFKSPMMWILLVGAIQISIWINLSVPYFMGNTITFFGYMIISSVQLGATVDYAILYGGRYLEKRRSMPSLDSATESLTETTSSILTSALILFGAGTIISSIAPQDMVSELGSLLGRGAMLSAAMVLLILPNAIRFCDRALQKSTYKSNFWEGSK